MPVEGYLRIGAIGDMHCQRLGISGKLRSLFAQIAKRSDVLLLCGDITDYGKREEARLLVAALPELKEIPASNQRSRCCSCIEKMLID